MELVNTISHINNHLCDDESKKLFNARLKYSLSKNEKLFIEESGIMSQDLSCREWEDFTKTLSPNISVVIFGAGTDGVYTYNLLKRCNWGKNVVAFCDNIMRPPLEFMVNILQNFTY